MKHFIYLTLVAAFAFQLGCGGRSGNDINHTTPPPPVVNIAISPTTASTLTNVKTQFSATVTGSTDMSVTWSIKEENAGAISGGLYTAPATVGTYHIVATANADKTKSAAATVAVSAKFAFMEQKPGPVGADVLFIPMIGTYAPDGSFSIAAVNDPSTNAPMSITNMEAISLSPDGTKIAYNTQLQDPSNCCVYNIYVMNSDGTGRTQLTTDGQSWYPTFSPDGKQIMGIHEGAGPEIGVINIDGSNPHVVFSAGDNSAEVWSAAWSPDGTKIVAAMDWKAGQVTFGIVMMNADGTNPVVVVPDTYGQESCSENYRPSFTTDGTQVLFSRACYTSSTPPIESAVINVVNVDGTGLTALHDAGPNTFSYGPTNVAGKIVFQSNEQDGNFEIYSMKPDGSSLTRLTTNVLYDGFDEEYYWFAIYNPQSRMRFHHKR